MNRKHTGMIIAAAVGALFAAAAMAQATTAGQPGSTAGAAVKCMGGNSCKGQSSCAGATNSCKGKNSCKGQGFSMTADAATCKASGGRPQ